MKTDFSLRLEAPEDAAAIHDLTERAFEPMAFSDGTEPGLPEALREAGALLLSLVAVSADGNLLGQVTFSPLTFEPETAQRWAGLGPIAVEPGFQKQGIGSALVKEGLRRLKAQGFDGVGLIGNPLVYGPMGFISTGEQTYAGLEPKFVQIISLSDEEPPAGEMVFHPSFGG